MPPQSVSDKEWEGNSDTDLSLRLTSLSHKPDTGWEQGVQPNTRDQRARR